MDTPMEQPTGTRALMRKLVRYSLASVAATVVGQTALYLLVAVVGWAGVPANLTAVTIGAMPNYLINRYWTWEKRGPHSIHREVMPFWVLTLFGLALSTLFVYIADRQWGTTLAIMVANMLGFAVVWAAKFVVLDRVLFRVEDPVSE